MSHVILNLYGMTLQPTGGKIEKLHFFRAGRHGACPWKLDGRVIQVTMSKEQIEHST
jgi:hypothetical protein